MKLYFLRHGLAGDRSTWSGTDRERPLTPEGIDLIQREAVSIDRLKLEIDLIITSPLTRAVQTAEIVARQLKLIDRLIQDERVASGLNIDVLAQLLSVHPPAMNAMLVGHEPTFSQTISQLIGGGEIILKKGGLARIDVPDPKTLKGELIWLLPSKVLAL
jgi:phosphohistidine phosphatase